MPIPGLTTLGLILLCGALGGCVSSSGKIDTAADGIDRVVAGEPTFMQQTYMTMDKSCRQVKRPTAVLTQKPLHGSVRMLTRKAAAVYGPGPYAHCDGKVGKALAFEYTSAPRLSWPRRLCGPRALFRWRSPPWPLRGRGPLRRKHFRAKWAPFRVKKMR